MLQLNTTNEGNREMAIHISTNVEPGRVTVESIRGTVLLERDRVTDLWSIRLLETNGVPTVTRPRQVLRKTAAGSAAIYAGRPVDAASIEDALLEAERLDDAEHGTSPGWVRKGRRFQVDGNDLNGWRVIDMATGRECPGSDVPLWSQADRIATELNARQEGGAE